jgi:hypothetical protein
MLIALLLIAALAPGTQAHEPRSPAPQSQDAGATSGGEAPERRPGEGEQSDARKVHYPKAPWRDAGLPDGGPVSKKPAAAAGAASCESDDDCALTLLARGPKECCPSLCTPRAVTRRSAAEASRRAPACAGANKCPHLSCMPPRRRMEAACLHRRCVARPLPPADE